MFMNPLKAVATGAGKAVAEGRSAMISRTLSGKRADPKRTGNSNAFDFSASQGKATSDRERKKTEMLESQMSPFGKGASRRASLTGRRASIKDRKKGGTGPKAKASPSKGKAKKPSGARI